MFANAQIAKKSSWCQAAVGSSAGTTLGGTGGGCGSVAPSVGRATLVCASARKSTSTSTSTAPAPRNSEFLLFSRLISNIFLGETSNSQKLLFGGCKIQLSVEM